MKNLRVLTAMDCRSDLKKVNYKLKYPIPEDTHEDHSVDEMRDCDQIDGDPNNHPDSHATQSARLNNSFSSNGGDSDMNFSGAGGQSPGHQSDTQMSHHHNQYPPNHPLNALGNFMSIGSLHGLSGLQHSDVLEKLKMQVRDMNVGLRESDYAAAHAAAFSGNVLSSPMSAAFSMPPTSMPSFGHTTQSLAAAAAAIQTGSGGVMGSSGSSAGLGGGGEGAGGAGEGAGGSASGSGVGALTNGSASFSFASPTAPNTKDVNPASNSSTSSEASSSSQQNNGWSFEEQYKQVRQLYEINDDPERKEFLDELFSFMQRRGSPINRLPIMAKSVLDLYELYNLVIARGGLVDVINKKLWQEIIKGLHLPSSITSAAFTLRTQYMKYLYPYECEKKHLSTPNELQAAIDGNRREGRRSSYGQFEAMHNQMQIPQMPRQVMPCSAMQQMSPLALVSHAAAANTQQAQAAAVAAAHQRLMTPRLLPQDLEQRMRDYIKFIHVKPDQNAAAAAVAAAAVVASAAASNNAANSAIQNNVAGNAVSALDQLQQQGQLSPIPAISPQRALSAIEMSRMAFWQIYNNSTSPPVSVRVSPQGHAGNTGASCGSGLESQREALNLNTIKRERERNSSPLEQSEQHDDFLNQPPPGKRHHASAFPSSFYLPHGIAAAAMMMSQQSGMERDEEEHDNALRNGNQQLNGHRNDPSNNNRNINDRNEKSDDSAIENSPSNSATSATSATSAASAASTALAANGQISPLSTKRIRLNKPNECNAEAMSSNFLPGMQFSVASNATGANGESRLNVNLQFNGVQYSGVLVANVAEQPSVNPNINHNITDDEVKSDELEVAAADTPAREVTTPTNTAPNGSSSPMANTHL